MVLENDSKKTEIQIIKKYYRQIVIEVVDYSSHPIFKSYRIISYSAELKKCLGIKLNKIIKPSNKPDEFISNSYDVLNYMYIR